MGRTYQQVVATFILFSLAWTVYCEDDPCQLPADSGSCLSLESSGNVNVNGSVNESVNATSNSNGNGTSTAEEVPLKSARGAEEASTRFYYSSANYKCAPFPYSGCGGNKNNFATLEECEGKCGSKHIGDDVSKIKKALNNTKCWYNNKVYEVGQQIPETRLDSPCSVGCFCAEGSGTGNSPGPKITCAAIDCPPPPEKSKKCVPIYKENSCCPTDYVCEERLNVANTKNATVPFKCSFNGRNFVEGETIYPEQYPCHTCTCSRNFNGTLGTDVCREVNCGISIHNQYELVNQCEPQYYTTDTGKTLCCPIQWNCRNNQDSNQEEEE